MPHAQKLPTLHWDENPQASDIEAVRALTHGTGVFTAEEVRVAGELVEDALNEEEDYAFVFARIPGSKKLAGYACFGEILLTDNRYDLYWIAVANTYRQTGLAAEILTRAEQRMRNSGGRIVYAETSGKSIYEPARRFYLKNGYEEIARFPDFYRIDDDKLVYAKRLAARGSPRI